MPTSGQASSPSTWGDQVPPGVKEPRPTLCTVPREVLVHINRYLDVHDMAILSRTCKHVNSTTVRSMYLRDAAVGGSSAIKWAASRSRRPQVAVATDTIKLALQYQGNINSHLIHEKYDPNRLAIGYSSPLHVAAALGNRGIVRLLLDNGANVEARSHRLLHMEHIQHLQEFKKVQENPAWTLVFHDRAQASMLPLLLPIFLGHTDVVKMLIEAGAPQKVVESEMNMPQHHITRLHAAALAGRMDYVKRFVRNLHDHVDGGAVAGAFTTPLHIATKMHHVDMMTFLIENGASPYRSPTAIGHPPLLSLIQDYYAARTVKEREELFKIIEKLLELGVDPNVATETLSRRTPLMYAIDQLRYVYNMSAARFEELLKLLKALLNKGADPNKADSNGNTALHLIAMRAIVQPKDGQVRKFLTKLLEAGGRINVPMPNSHSLLFDFMQHADPSHKINTGQKTLLKLMMESGARLLDEEASDALKYWLQRPVCQVYNMTQHAAHITSISLRESYEHATEQADKVKFDLLRQTFGDAVADHSEIIIFNVLKSTHLHLRDVIHLSFNPNFIHPTEGGYIDMIVRKMLREPRKYKEDEAMTDARSLIKRGASLILMDELSPKSALGVFVRREDMYKNFLAYIMKRKAKEYRKRLEQVQLEEQQRAEMYQQQDDLLSSREQALNQQIQELEQREAACRQREEALQVETEATQRQLTLLGGPPGDLSSSTN